LRKGKGDSNAVLFLGDASVVDPLVHQLVDERMAASSKSLDFETFRFGERPVSDIEAALRQVGMFSPQRCIWLRGFVESRGKPAAGGDAEREDAEAGGQDGEAGGSNGLLELLERGVPAGTTLVVSAAALDARARLYKWFVKNAEVCDHRVQVEYSGARRGKLSEEGLRRAIEARLAELGVTQIGARTIEEIVARSGNVVGEMLQEVDRLVLALPHPDRIDVEQVRRNMRDLSLGWVFDFTDALESRNLARAESLIERLLGEGEPALRLGAMLASHIATLAAARPVVDSLPPDWLRMRGHDFLAGPGASLPDTLRGWPGYFRLRAASNFSVGELRRLHGQVRRLDAALKSSTSAPLLLFSRLLQSACISERDRDRSRGRGTRPQ